jgi:peroxiredoxin
LPVSSILNQKAPDFTLKGLDNKEVKLSQFKDKTVILDFFGTFSTTSKKQVAVMEKLYQKYKGQGLVVLGITSEKDRPKVQKFVTNNKLTFTILPDGVMTLKNYKVTQLPMLFFIKNGVVSMSFMGPNTYTETKLDAEIAKYFPSASASASTK